MSDEKEAAPKEVALKEATPDPEILRHNLRNAMQAVTGLRNRIKTLEDQLGAARGALALFESASPERRERLLRAFEALKDGVTVVDCTETWRPIDSMPTDGREILIYSAVEDVKLKMHQHVINAYPGLAALVGAVHWMPLPAPPKK